MTIQAIMKMGEPVLQAVAMQVDEFDTPMLYQLVQNMRETMLDSHGVGIAAPQIGVSLQVIVFGFEDNPRYPEAPALPWTVLINPLLTPLSDEMEEGWEGCLSVPGLRGSVPRYTHLRYQGFGITGEPINCVVEGFHARVVQHEYDHLQGILYPQRIRDMRQFGYTDVLFPGLDAED